VTQDAQAPIKASKASEPEAVAKLDRLSRDVGSIHWLIGSGVEVLFADLPDLTGAMRKFVLITMANVAELEAGLISERTKAALKAAKARGVRLGRHGAEVLAPKFKEEARQRAMELEPVITEPNGKGLSLARIASELNKPKVPPPRGSRVGSLVGPKCTQTLRLVRHRNLLTWQGTAPLARVSGL